MKINKSLLSILTGGLILLAGCKEYRTEYSPQTNTVGTVVEKKHIAEHYLNPIDNINPMRHIDPLFDMKKGRMLTKQREEFRVVVNTDVGSLTRNDKGLFNSVEENSHMNVSYREIYRLTYDDLNKDGTKELVGREFIGYEFLDIANPKP